MRCGAVPAAAAAAARTHSTNAAAGSSGRLFTTWSATSGSPGSRSRSKEMPCSVEVLRSSMPRCGTADCSRGSGPPSGQLRLWSKE